MVYSTCAFNPVEDEAVVAQLLRSSQGTFLNPIFFVISFFCYFLGNTTVYILQLYGNLFNAFESLYCRFDVSSHLRVACDVSFIDY